MDRSSGTPREPTASEDFMRLFLSSPEFSIGNRQTSKLADKVREFHNLSVGSSTDSRSLESTFSGTRLPDKTMRLNEYQEFLSEHILPYAANVYSRFCLGHMSGTPPDFFWGLNEIVTALNQNMVKRDASQVFSILERQVLAVMHRLVFDLDDLFYGWHVHRDDSSLGIMTSGGTLANVTALWVARNLCFPPHGEFRGVEAEGLYAALRYYGYDGAAIVGSELLHYSIDKAAAILGMGVESVIKVPVDSSYRMDVGELRSVLRQCAGCRRRIIGIVAVAGTTDAGSIDPLDEIGKVAEEAGVHLHVDAAWGAPLLFSQRERHKLLGLNHAASVTLDGHKQMHLPIGSGVLLFRDPTAAAAIEKRASYILQEDSGDLGSRSLEGSRPASALLFHAALHVIGAHNYGFLIDENIRKARVFAELIRQHQHFRLLAEPQSNIVLYHYVPQWWADEHDISTKGIERLNAYNEAIQRAQSAAGRTFVSRTTILTRTAALGAQGRRLVALRAVVSNPFTRDEDFKTILDDQTAVARELEHSFRPRA
jgi:glutamate decarboxylase